MRSRAVGEAIAECIGSDHVKRSELFLQTKFTFRAGQDHRLPYDPKAPIPKQVEQSLDSSLKHLGTNFIDSYLLHGPTQRTGLTREDWQAWRAMEAIRDSGQARWLGISNVTLDQLRALCEQARVHPRFVQNRCYAVRGWDRAIRQYCAAHGIIYQGFSLLTANREVLAHPEIIEIAQRLGRTVSQIVLRFALEVGMVALTGTTNVQHMRDDLAVLDFRLTPDEMQRIDRLAEQ